MRTTVTLADDVALRTAMRERGVSFKEVLNSAVRSGLSVANPSARPYQVKPFAAEIRPGSTSRRSTGCWPTRKTRRSSASSRSASEAARYQPAGLRDQRGNCPGYSCPFLVRGDHVWGGGRSLPVACLICFVRLTTRRAVMDPALTTDRAIDYVQAWLTQPCATTVHPTYRHLAVLRSCLTRLAQQAIACRMRTWPPLPSRTERPSARPTRTLAGFPAWSGWIPRKVRTVGCPRWDRVRVAGPARGRARVGGPPRSRCLPSRHRGGS
jgi:hypothetical protein